ncbi:MAG: hypothetical protein QM757_39935 [Paludibaculum sp.]
MPRVLIHTLTKSIQTTTTVLLLAAVAGSSASAQIWPEAWHGSTRGKVQVVTADDPMLWVEYGGDAAEQAAYNGPVGKFQATAWRLKDATSALAWYQAVRPATCAGVPNLPLICTTSGSQYIAHDNYVLRFDGWRPLDQELNELFTKLPRIRSGGGLPEPSRLPAREEPGEEIASATSLVVIHWTSSLRACQRPWSASRTAQRPKWAVSRPLAAGSFSVRLIFDYHTPQLAMLRAREFEKQAGWTVQRTGPYIAVVPGGADPKVASAILGKSEWNAQFTWNTPGKLPKMPNVGGMLVAIFELTGVPLVTCLGGGILFACLWVYLRHRRIRLDGGDEAITIIHLHDTPQSQ